MFSVPMKPTLSSPLNVFFLLGICSPSGFLAGRSCRSKCKAKNPKGFGASPGAAGGSARSSSDVKVTDGRLASKPVRLVLTTYADTP